MDQELRYVSVETRESRPRHRDHRRSLAGRRLAAGARLGKLRDGIDAICNLGARCCFLATGAAPASSASTTSEGRKAGVAASPAATSAAAAIKGDEASGTATGTATSCSNAATATTAATTPGGMGGPGAERRFRGRRVLIEDTGPDAAGTAQGREAEVHVERDAPEDSGTGHRSGDRRRRWHRAARARDQVAHARTR